MTTIKFLLIGTITVLISINHVNLLPTAPKEGPQYRLINDVKPNNYQIELTTNLEKAMFNGVVKIGLTALKSTKTIQLHNVDLELKSVKVETVPKKGKPVENIELENEFPYNVAGQFSTITTKESMPKGEYSLTITFEGKLKEEESGYYLHKYKSEKDEKTIAVTSFEPIFARKAFPCFDEPELKATFIIKLTHDKTYTAYSNTEIKTVKNFKDDKIVTTEFEQTPQMSTFSVAFALTPADFVKSSAEKDERTFLVVRKDIKSQVDYILPKASSYLKGYETLTGTVYDKTLKKLTHLSIPNQSKANIMENWGLVAYSEDDIIYDKSIDPLSKKLGNQRTVAHQLSNQWFGNLVTPKWWTHLWLKEGFASYFEYVIMDKDEPSEFGTFQEYLAQVHHRFFKLDSSINSRAMDKEVESPEDIVNNYDVVQYEKGAQLLYMLENIIGTDIFMAGIKKYVQDNQYKSVEPTDLWKALQEKVDETSTAKILDEKKITDIGASWSKAGYPVIDVTVNKKELKFSQKRFLTDSTKKDKSLWLVPINYVTNLNKNDDVGSTAPTHWLEKKSLDVSLDEAIDFVIVNNEQTGYYRVNYESSNWKAISDHLFASKQSIIGSYEWKSPKLSTVTHAQLLDDAFTFAENGDLSYEVAIDLTRFLVKVDQFLPWKPASAYLINIYDKISMTPTLTSYEQYLSKLIKKAFIKVSFNNEHKTNVDGLLQEKILPLVVRAKSPEFIAAAEKLMDEIKKKSTSVSKPLQRYVFCGAANKEVEYLINQLKEKEESEFSKDDLLFGLSCLSSVDNIEKVLKDCEDEDKFVFVKYVAELNPLMVYKNTDVFKTGLEKEEIKEVVKMLAVRIGTEEQLKNLEELNEDGEYDELFKLAKDNQQWNTNNEDLHDWISKEMPIPGPTTPDTTNPTSDPSETSDPTDLPPNVTTEDDTGGALSTSVCSSILSLSVLVVYLMY